MGQSGGIVTGYRSSLYRHDCAERGCQIKALPDWDDLLECFAGSVIPTDIDAMVHRFGIRGRPDRFLFLEGKGAGVPVPRGQLWALQALGSLPGVTVRIMRPAGEALDVLTFPRPGEFQRMSRNLLKHQLRVWDAGLR